MSEIISLDEIRLSKKSEEELLVITIERMVYQLNKQTEILTQMSNRISVLEQHLSSSSVPLLSDEEDS